MHGGISLKMTATAPEATLCAYQTIDLYKSSSTTFLLSGWGKGNSVPGFAEEIEGKNDNSLKYWGIVLTLNYADGTASEHFHLPFCDYATDWQYAAMSVTPKASDKTITTAVIKLYYKNNANTAYFDSISLIEEPAQTYKYDKDGNLVSVKSSGNGEDEYKFADGTTDLEKMMTEGSGDYKYEYPETGNTHLPVRIINDTVTMHIDYDAAGRTTQTALKDNTGGSPLTMVSTAQYQDGLLKKVTDNTEAATSYGYDSRRRAILVANAAGTETWTNYDNIWDRAVSSYQPGVISVANTYVNGNITEITRGGFVTPGSTKQEQKYLFTYDSFGRNTSVSVGSYKIADYRYNTAGSLTKIGYGSLTSPLTVVSYTYDVDGIRQSKTVNGNTTKYITLDGKVVRETNGNVTTDYFYDNEGKPYKIIVRNNTTSYTGYYALNQQGDVIAILDAYGNTAVSYEYNAWGGIINETSSGNIQSMNLQSYNHLKYRGYFHDAETGFYYVSSRYYDPVIGRFINEDALVSTGQGFLGYNMFVYCLNNPVNYNDPKGTLAYPGEIHNEVVRRVAKKYGYKKEQFILYKNGGFGRADLISSKGQVWDVKRDKPKQIEAGKKQVKKYVENTWAKSPDTPLSVGGNKIQSDLFYYKSGLITYKVNYRYAGDGVIAYDYSISEVDYQTLGVAVLIAGAIVATSGIAAGAIGTLGGAITCFV